MEIVSDKSRVLILSYFFPPCNKVGGRRWAKFGKYLKKRNFSVFVLTVNVPFSGHCPWEDDVASYGNNIYHLPYIVRKSFHQRVMRPSSVLGKIRYRVSKLTHDWRVSAYKGDYSDISKGYKQMLTRQASKIIAENKITDLIVTGGPFYWLYYGTLLKKEYPQLRVLADFRDYWTSGEGFNSLSDKAQKHECEKERIVLELADVITTPAERISHYLKSTYKELSHKIHVLPHGYDQDELPQSIRTIADSKTICFVYGGILYEKMDVAIVQFAEILNKLLILGYNVRADIYTFGEKYRELFKDKMVDHVVNYHETLKAKDFFLKCADADFLLQFRAGETNEQHFRSTKFYELLALKKLIIYFGPNGEVSDYLLSKGVGFSFVEGAEKLIKNIVAAKEGKIKIKEGLSVDQFSYSSLTENLIKLLGK